jgi:hypothetical protein
MEPAVRRRRVIVVLGTAAVLLVVAALVYFFVPATSFSPEALGYSVTRETGGHGPFEGSRPCEPDGKDRWRCEVWSMVRSGYVNYRVEMEASRCWHGRRAAPGRGLPREVSGCLKVRDQLRLWDRVF